MGVRHYQAEPPLRMKDCGEAYRKESTITYHVDSVYRIGIRLHKHFYICIFIYIFQKENWKFAHEYEELALVATRKNRCWGTPFEEQEGTKKII